MTPSKESLPPARRGRPPVGQTPVRAIRLSDELMTRIANWRKGRVERTGDSILNDSEAVRALLEFALDQQEAMEKERSQCRMAF